MTETGKNALRYSIFDPTGNITALVESPVEEARQSAAAAALMARHPEIEQVGFVRFCEGGPVRAELCMAGGEFCGNASMSAAALCCLRQGSGAPENVLLRVSGTQRTVEVRVKQETAESFSAAVDMPPAKEIAEAEYAFGALRGGLPIVRMEGIAHAIISRDSAFFALRDDPAAAAETVRALCTLRGEKCLGLMFLEMGAPCCRLTPLVYVPGSGTLFWETSCASGSAAAGMYLASRTGRRQSLRLQQPGGILRVESDPQTGGSRLYGRTRLLGEYAE